MDLLQRKDLDQLSDHADGPSVSLYVPPTLPFESGGPPDFFQDQLRLAHEMLRRHGASAAEAAEILEPAQSLMKDRGAWSGGTATAIFCAPQLFRAYAVHLRVDYITHVGRGFHLRPLWSLFRQNGRYFVLALTDQEARFYHATQQGILEHPLLAVTRQQQGLPPAGTTGDPAQVVALSQRIGMNAPEGARCSVPSENPGEHYRRDLIGYFQRVDAALQRFLQDERSPMILACVGYLAPIYHAVNSYPFLVTGKVPGNPALWSPDELKIRAGKLLERAMKQQLQCALMAFGQAAHRGNVLSDLHELTVAAANGDVDSLYLTEPAAADEVPTAEEQEMLDRIVAKTLAHHGDFYLLPPKLMPCSAVAAATLRGGHASGVRRGQRAYQGPEHPAQPRT